MKSKLFAVALMSLFFSNVSVAAIDEGIEYQLITPAQPTITKDKIEVVEMFWFGCPHCYHFEPDLNDWLAKKPDNVVFVRIPAVFSAPWALHARAYYTAQTLGLYDNDSHKFHDAFFDEFHNKKNQLMTKQALQAFFARFGVSADDFNNTFNSFAVNIKVNRATTLSKRYQLQGVPSLIINGKYRVDGPMAGGRKGMIKVTNFLIDKESKK